LAPARRAAVTARSSKVTAENSHPAAFAIGAQVSPSMASRSSAENSGALPGCTPMASTSRSASRAACRTTSTCPLVTGSNDPA
jgi:hypothetical protein